MPAGDSAKADQIAFHIYTKLFHVVHAARASEQGPPSGKTDKWFNLETPLAASATVPASSLDAYRALSASPAPRPLAIQVLLAVPPPGGGTALVHTPSRTRVDPAPRFVLLEEWVLAFAAPASSSASAHSAASTSTSTSRSSSTDDGGDVAPPTIYKNAIPLFRALFALLRVLPAWRAVRKLAGRRAANGGRLRVVLRVADAEGGQGWGGDPTLEFGDSPAPGVGAEPLPTSTHVFPPILHPAGESFLRLLSPFSMLSSLISPFHRHPSVLFTGARTYPTPLPGAWIPFLRPS
ncbi:autophagy-related protein 13-domain-containing protein [Mycena belliarum]|uniref:Autophagy-related protein 13 n=1 Tax=Mycena belliarum TaxID=1033014 RepID=A0AAD6TTY1_9AGAR|nr:autophagy-related protein 13-domain-containing protein [Mycena belliae]